MIVDVVMPAQGLTITEATLIKWVKQPGDEVKAGELLFEVETDKAAIEVESEVSGRLLLCIAAEGDVVQFGRVIAKIGTEASDTLEAAAPPAAAPTSEPPKAEAQPEPPKPQSNGSLMHMQIAAIAESARPVASPRAKRAAEKLGVDLLLVQATGRRGKHIRERDVLLAAEHKPTQQAALPESGLSQWQTVPFTPPTSAGVGTGASPLSRLRRITAQRTAASFRDVPHFYLSREISAERLLAFRAEIVNDIEKHTGVRITATDLLLRALAAALQATPAVNAQWNNDNITPLSSIDVGLAVDTPEGLIVPMIRAADTLSLAGIARRRTELVERARNGQSRPEDLTGGSFTLSNLGAGGVDQFDAIINTPQSGILSAGSIKPRPYVVDGALAAVNTLHLTVSIDHRVVDGAEAARFLSRIADYLENPILLCAL